MTKKTVVVTGIGAISPLAATAPETWDALLAGKSGITRIEDPRYAELELPVEFAGQARRSCQVPIGSYAVLEGDALWLRGLIGSPDGTAMIRGELFLRDLPRPERLGLVMK